MRAAWLSPLLLVPLLACRAHTASPATLLPSASPTAASTPSAIFERTPSPTLSPAASPTPRSVRSCQLPSRAHLGLGWPRSPERLPSLGTVRAVVLFADFEDAPASRSPQAVLALLSPQAEDFLAAQSYGRFALQLEPHYTWLRLSQPAAHYGASLSAYAPHLAFLQEAVDLADAQVDFSGADLVIVLSNPDAEAIAYGPTYTGFRSSGLQADGVIIANGMTSGRDLLYWGWMWLPHELGHSLGLPDLYAYDAPLDQFPYSGGYSLMGNIFGFAPELSALERWLLGWLADEQVYCLPAGEALTVELTPIERQGGMKAVLLPLGAGRLLVVESRRAEGYDHLLPEPGALVYVVDANLASGYGPLVVWPPAQEDAGLAQATLQRGEALNVAGYTIEVLASTAGYDRVRLAPATPGAP